MKVEGKRNIFKKFFTDAGYDLVVSRSTRFSPFETKPLPHDVRVIIPEGHVGLVVPRSSARKVGFMCLSIYDPGYSGLYEPFVTNCTPSEQTVEKGRRIVQLIILPLSAVHFGANFKERGDRGVGSTGK